MKTSACIPGGATRCRGFPTDENRSILWVMSRTGHVATQSPRFVVNYNRALGARAHSQIVNHESPKLRFAGADPSRTGAGAAAPIPVTAAPLSHPRCTGPPLSRTVFRHGERLSGDEFQDALKKVRSIPDFR